MVRRFWAYVAERERIRLSRQGGDRPAPWTTDKILQTYKFTNIRREDDRTTRWMREHWTGPHLAAPPPLQLFNCAVFRYFGTVEMAERIGWQDGWYPGAMIKTARAALDKGEKVFTGAYLITNAGTGGPKERFVVNGILEPFYEACLSLTKIAHTEMRWEAVAKAMYRLPGFGGSGFMAKEVLQDVIHGTNILGEGHHLPWDRNSWCPAGPGARRGLSRLLGAVDPKAEKLVTSEDAALGLMLELFQMSSRWIGYHQTLVDSFTERPLELHDIQWNLCEFDKYERVRRGQGKPRAKFVPTEG